MKLSKRIIKKRINKRMRSQIEEWRGEVNKRYSLRKSFIFLDNKILFLINRFFTVHSIYFELVHF